MLDARPRTGRLAIDFAGVRVLVTGGSRGIAREIVRQFAANGAEVAFGYAADADAAAGHPAAAEETAMDIRRSGGTCHAIEADLGKPGAAQRLVAACAEAMGRIDVLVLSASIQIHKDFLAISSADIAAQLQINLVANVELAQAAIPAMRARGWGRVISIGSVQEASPSLEMPIYAMTKAALENMVRTLAVANAPYGITVNNVSPGLVQTDRNAFRRRDPAAWSQFSRDSCPAGRAGQPADIAPAVLFLSSDAAGYITGATLPISGGAHIARAGGRRGANGAHDFEPTAGARPADRNAKGEEPC